MHNLIFLDDLNGADLDPYVRLNEAQLFHALEPDPGLFIAESPKVIERALRAGYQPASLLVEEKALTRDLADLDHEMAANQTSGLGQTPIYVANSKLLRQLPGYNLLRGALAAMHRVKRLELADFLATMPAEHPRIAVLESVVNPANIGAIFRSAAALGIDGVIVPATRRILFIAGLRAWRWVPFFKYLGPMLMPKPGSMAALICFTRLDIRRQPWHCGIIPSALTILS